MTKYSVTMQREDEEALGLKVATFDVPEDMYAMIFDILTGRLTVQPPAEAPKDVPVEDAPVEIADAEPPQ